MLKSISAHASTAASVIGIIGVVFVVVVQPAAQEFIGDVVDQKVEDRLNDLERSLRSLEANDAARAGQLAVQNERLESIGRQQNETSSDIKVILRALTSPSRRD